MLRTLMSPTKAVSGSSKKRTRSTTVSKMQLPSEEKDSNILETIEENIPNSKKESKKRLNSPEHPMFTATDFITATVPTSSSSSSFAAVPLTAQISSNALVKHSTEQVLAPVREEVCNLLLIFHPDFRHQIL